MLKFAEKLKGKEVTATGVSLYWEFLKNEICELNHIGCKQLCLFVVRGGRAHSLERGSFWIPTGFLTIPQDASQLHVALAPFCEKDGFECIYERADEEGDGECILIGWE